MSPSLTPWVRSCGSISWPRSNWSADWPAIRSRPTAPIFSSSGSSCADIIGPIAITPPDLAARSSPSSPTAAAATAGGSGDVAAQGRLPALVLPPPPPRAADRQRPDERASPAEDAGEDSPNKLTSRDEVARLLSPGAALRPHCVTAHSSETMCTRAGCGRRRRSRSSSPNFGSRSRNAARARKGERLKCRSAAKRSSLSLLTWTGRVGVGRKPRRATQCS